MRAYLDLLRPHQWTKNVFCLAGVLFSGDFRRDPSAIGRALVIAGCFCAVSSAGYIANDLIDRERDRRHPVKWRRPLASATVSVPGAAFLGLVLGLAGLAAGYFLTGGVVLGCLGLFLVNNLAYSWRFKHLALFDVLCIALGFVLRLLAGVYGIGELPTAWIVLCTFFLTVFLGFAKRRAELGILMANGVPEETSSMSLGKDAGSPRPVLAKYTLESLDSLLTSSAVMVVMCYALFTTVSGKNLSLVVTVPIVFFAVMHYQRLVMMWNFGEEPDWILLKDLRLQVSIALWLICYLVIMYGGLPPLFRPDVPH